MHQGGEEADGYQHIHRIGLGLAAVPEKPVRGRQQQQEPRQRRGRQQASPEEREAHEACAACHEGQQPQRVCPAAQHGPDDFSQREKKRRRGLGVVEGAEKLQKRLAQDVVDQRGLIVPHRIIGQIMKKPQT